MDINKRVFLGALAAMLVGRYTPPNLWGSPAAPKTRPSQRLIIVITGGMRREETFSDRGKLNIPHLYGDLLPNALFCAHVRNEGVTSHFNSISSILTGNWQRVDDWGNSPPASPTLFEYARRQGGLPGSEVWMVASNKALTNQIGASSSGTYGAPYGANVGFPKALLIWAGKRLFDGSQAVLVFNQGAAAADVKVAWSDIGLAESESLYVRNLWTHQTSGPHRGGISVRVAPNDVALLRASKTKSFAVPLIIVADSYLVSLRAAGMTAQKLTGAITVKTNGSDELPLWKVRPGLPPWLSVAVRKTGKSQTLTSTASTAGLKNGLYHAVVRADNIEPVSGKPISALYYDVDLEVTGRPGGRGRE